MDSEYTAYVQVFFEEYAKDLAELAKEIGVEPSNEKFRAIVRVCCSLLKVGDYDYIQYISTCVREYFLGSFQFCDEIINKVGYKSSCVENPETTIYPEKFMNGDNFDIERYCFLLTCLSEALNNLIRKQKYTDHETKKKLLNHRPLNIILRKNNVDSTTLPTRTEFIMVARTYFQLVSSSCFHSAKHGAYPYVLDDGWDQHKYHLNGKLYTVKNLMEWYPEFTWEGTMKVISGDKGKNIKPIYPANTFNITGDYPFYECTQTTFTSSFTSTANKQ